MALDPRRCVLPSEVNITAGISGSTKRKDLFDQIGKIGNIDALKDFGATKVGKGARFLKKISDVVGGGGSSFLPGEGDIPGVSVPSFISQTIEKGADAVAGIVDPSGAVTDFLRKVDPTALNTARNELKNVYETVKQGGFKLEDAPELLESIVNAERNINQQINQIFPFGNADAGYKTTVPALKDCNMAIPYATSLANRFSPKFKFLFVVEFVFHPELNLASRLFPNFDDVAKNAAFLIREASRPNYTIEYEDVNMYNYRTRVAKGLKYDNTTFTFYDDNQDNVMNFYQVITRLLNPISNMQSAAAVFNESNQFDIINGQASEDGSTAPAEAPIENYHNYRTGSVASLNLTQFPYNIFKQINVYHIYDFGQNVTLYQYMEPQLISAQMSPLTMTESDPCDVTFEFSYNALRVQNGFNFPGPVDAVTTGEEQIDDYPDQSFDIQQISAFGNENPIGGDYVSMQTIPQELGGMGGSIPSTSISQRALDTISNVRQQVSSRAQAVVDTIGNLF